MNRTEQFDRAPCPLFSIFHFFGGSWLLDQIVLIRGARRSRLQSHAECLQGLWCTGVSWKLGLLPLVSLSFLDPPSTEAATCQRLH